MARRRADRLQLQLLAGDRRAFWQQIYKLREVYAGEAIEGWIGKFFPYLRGRETQRYERQNPVFADAEATITSADVPCGLTQVPFLFVTDDTSTPMQFFAGATYDAGTRAVRPKVGWAITGDARIERLVRELKSGRHRLAPRARRSVLSSPDGRRRARCTPFRQDSVVSTRDDALRPSEEADDQAPSMSVERLRGISIFRSRVS